MGLRSRLRDLAERIERFTLESEREADQKRREKQLPDELKSALIEQGFELTGDQEYPMSSRTIELKRGQLAVRIESDRGWWFIEIRVWESEFYDIGLWMEFLDTPDSPDEDLPFTRQAAYLISRLDRIDTLVSDRESSEVSERLKDLAVDRYERRFPRNNMRLEQSLGKLLSEAGDVTQQGEQPVPIEYARRGAVFAARPVLGVIELRLGDEIGEAAMRTPSTGPSGRGADWIRFAPPDWDEHAVDRLEAWFRVAWRFADHGKR